MFDRQLAELESEPFMAQFRRKDCSDTWLPAGTRMASHVDLRLESNSSGRCTRAQLRLNPRLTSHPVWSPICHSLVSDFLHLSWSRLPWEASEGELLRRGPCELSFEGVVMTREEGEEKLCFTLSPEVLKF